MKVHCKYDELVSIKELKPHPKNRNEHPEEQIKRLAKILEYQGFRYPIKVSLGSGFVTSGHGRIEAAKLNGWTQVPVNYQEYESEEQEYADLIADNSIASWSDLDFSSINADLPDLGPDFDIEMLGLKDFYLDASDKIDRINKGDELSEWVDLPDFKEGDGYIKLIYIFGSEASREKFVSDNSIKITMKKSNQWIVHHES
jgi:hypothetical protein